MIVHTAMEMAAPTTAAGWVALLASLVFIFGSVTGAAMAIGKRWINQSVGEVVRESIDKAMQPVKLELITMNGEMKRVRKIEQKIENGLSMEVDRIGTVVNDIQSHLMWDGSEERRNV